DDRKAAEELLLLSEARFKSLVQNNSDLVVVVDPQDRITYASPSSTEMVGEAPEELFGRALSSVFVGADLDWSGVLQQWSTEGGTREVSFSDPVGEGWLTFEVMVTDLRDEAAVGGFVLNARDVTERNAMAHRLVHQATHDSLTGMPNRILLVEDLERMLAHNSGSSSVSAVCIDLDNFREINENLGQDVGDEVLIAVSQRIGSTLSFGDQAARIGADEFAVVVERAHGEDSVMEMTESILEQLAQPFRVDGRELTLTASAGIAVDHDREVGAEALLSNSITAMHQAKQEGRGRAVRFESAMRAASTNRLEIRGDLARAIGTEQIVVHYQPLVDLRTHTIVGAEALVRWDHPERGRLSPALFIPIAEDSGLIDALDAQVRAQACKDLAAWRSDIPGARDLTVSVNLSVGELRDDELVENVLRDLAASGLPAGAGARGDRVAPAGRQRHRANEDAAAAEPGREAGHRRLRHRLLLPGLHRPLRVRRAQDRQVVRGGSRDGDEPAHRLRGARPGQAARCPGRCRGDRGHRPGGAAPRARL
ncbi:MAG: diguanylate cyclase, partial [Microthrixaceae bacterium]